jgi:hypothetical protein
MSRPQPLAQSNFYLQYMNEISNYMAALGLFSQLPFYILNDFVSQILQNYMICHIYQHALVVTYLCRIGVRIVNLRFWLMEVTHIDRMKLSAAMIFTSYVLVAVVIAFHPDLNNLVKND